MSEQRATYVIRDSAPRTAGHRSSGGKSTVHVDTCGIVVKARAAGERVRIAAENVTSKQADHSVIGWDRACGVCLPEWVADNV